MSIILGNDEGYETDAITVSGRKMCIKVTDTGYYRIDVEGVGDKPQLCEHLFTNLSEARKAIRRYVAENVNQINKQAFLEEMATMPSIKDQRKAERVAKSASE